MIPHRSGSPSGSPLRHLWAKSFLPALFILGLIAVSSPTCSQTVRTGSDILLGRRLGLLEGKNVGVVSNQTSVLPNGVHLVDTLIASGIRVRALFSPEHGIRGTAGAGETVGDSTDRRTGLPLYSLYGRRVKPTPEMLRGLDILLFDLQDVGARFYTYQSTLAKVMEAAAENHLKIVVLDRPDPVNGRDVEGPVLDTALRSFVGLFPVPVRHGLTLGELSRMIKGEWSPGEVDLTVIPMEGWNRSMWYDETGLAWIPPSPNMRSLATATVYPGTCIFEGTNVSEGRGTEKPFEYIGAPWINGDTLASDLSALDLEGVRFLPVRFTPRPDPVAAPDPKYAGVRCGGVFVWVKDRTLFHPVRTALAMLATIRKLCPDSLKIRPGGFDRLVGTVALRTVIEGGGDWRGITVSCEAEMKRFLEKRKKYLLY